MFEELMHDKVRSTHRVHVSGDGEALHLAITGIAGLCCGMLYFHENG